MRVTYATYPWAFETIGGGEIQLLKYEQYLPACGVEIVRHDPWTAQFASAEIVHFFSCVGGSIHFCRQVKHRGLPLVVSASLWVTEATKHLYPIDEIKAQLSLADRIVTNAEMESDQLAAVLDIDRARFATVRNGCDARFLDPVDSHAFRSRFDITGEFLLSVGNVEPRKNQLHLIRAARTVGLPLVVIGDVRSVEYAEACWDEGGSGVRYLGALDHEDPVLRSAYSASTALCLPSTLETPGLAALEAAAVGTRLVVTSEGSTREYFREDVVYVDPTSVPDIANGILRALKQQPSLALKSRVKNELTWDRVVSPLAEIYRQLSTRA